MRKMVRAIGISMVFISFLTACGGTSWKTFKNDDFSISLPSGWKEIKGNNDLETISDRPITKFTIQPRNTYYFYNENSDFPQMLKAERFKMSSTMEERDFTVKDLASYVYTVEDFAGTPKQFKKINGKEFYLNGSLDADKSYYACGIHAVTIYKGYIYGFQLEIMGEGTETGPKIINSIKINDSVTPIDATAYEEEKRQAKQIAEQIKTERDTFVRKYISNFDPESFVEIEASKLDTFLRRNEGNVPKCIKILDGSIYDNDIKKYGIEMVDVTDAGDQVSIPDAKLVITRSNKRRGDYSNLEVLVIDNGNGIFNWGGDNSKFPKLRAIYLPPTTTHLDLTYPLKIDIFSSPNMKLTCFTVQKYSDESIQIPDSVEELYFLQSPKLKNIQISPQSRLAKIDFYSTGVTSIYLPETIKDFCYFVPKSLRYIAIAAKSPPENVKESSFPKTIEKIYVPAESLKVYEEAWYDYEFTFKNQLTAITDDTYLQLSSPVDTKSSGQTVNFSRVLEVKTPRMNGPDVIALQKRLLSLGFNQIGEADGYYGPMAENVVKSIQKLAGFEENGKVEPALWDFIFSNKILEMQTK